MKLIALLAASSLLAASTLSARADNLPAKVQAEVAELKKSCEPEYPTFNKGFIARKDINGDGIEDFVLDYGKFQCGDKSSEWCGSGGCTMKVIASTYDKKYIEVIGETVRGVTFKKIGGRSAMIVSYSGVSCDRANFEACSATLYWNGGRFSPAN